MCALTSTFFMLVHFHLILCHSLSSSIAPSCSLPHSIILYNFLSCMLFPASFNGLQLPLILCDILLSYLTFSHLISFLLPILFPIFHHIQCHFSHPLIFNVPLILLLLSLILAHIISSHTTTSYPTLSLLFLLYHFHSSYRLSGCPILFLVILFCFLLPHILSYLLCTLFSLFTSCVVPACLLPLSLILDHLIYAISYVLSCFTTISHPVPLLFPTYLDHIQCHFLSSFITSSHVVRIPLIISYFLSL